jgi:hypothetical protein
MRKATLRPPVLLILGPTSRWCMKYVTAVMTGLTPLTIGATSQSEPRMSAAAFFGRPHILGRLPTVLQVWTAGLVSGNSLGKPIISAIGLDGIPRKNNIVAI